MWPTTIMYSAGVDEPTNKNIVRGDYNIIFLSTTLKMI